MFELNDLLKEGGEAREEGVLGAVGLPHIFVATKFKLRLYQFFEGLERSNPGTV